MSDLTKLTLKAALDGLEAKRFSATELTKAHVAAVEAARSLNAYALETPEKALEMASKRWGLTVQVRGRALAVAGVRPGSPAQQLGLKPGDVLVKIAGEAQASVTDFARAFKRYRMANTVMLLVARDGRGYHVRLRV